MKLIIDIPEQGFEACKLWVKNGVATWQDGIIAKGTKYEERPTGEYQKRALELIDSLEDADKITVRQVGTLRRAILAEPDRPIGEWIPIKDKKGKEIACECSLCGKNPKYDVHSDYCPNCGAKMKGDSEE